MEDNFNTGYTDFVDDAEEHSFDNFLSRKRLGMQKKIRKLMAQGMSRTDAIKEIKGDTKGGIAEWIKKQGLSLKQSSPLMPSSPESAREDDLMPSSPESARPSNTYSEKPMPRFSNKKAMIKWKLKQALLKAKAEGRLLSQDEVAKIKANEQIDEDEAILTSKGIAPVTKTSLSGANADSFFQKNKKAIMIAGAVAVAGIVYFKFIKK